MMISKRMIAIFLAVVLSLSLMLTACNKSGDNPTGENSTPGTTSGGDIGNSEMKPNTDVSKYYSADKKEFNIVKCAEDMGFNISHTQSSSDNDQANPNSIARRAIFPFGYSDYNDANEEVFLCYESEKSQFCFSFYGYVASYGFSDDKPFGKISLSDEIYTKEKDILITGRPTEDEAAPTYKKVYANTEIINA